MKATSDWLAGWTRFRPNAEAVYDVGTGKRWTYAELYRDSLGWAARLQAAGVVAGDRVAVLAHNRGETFALLFAVAELGAVLVPLNWRLAGPELTWQLERADARVLLTDAANHDVVRWPSLSLDEGPGDPADLTPGPGSDLDDPWMMMFTSGSTGRPKGALLTHRQVHWNAVNTTVACDLRPDDATLTFAPLFHTGGMNCLSTPLLHRGGRVVLTPTFDAGAALELIAEERITHLMGVPTIYQMLADHADFADTDLSCVRDALCGGAALHAPLLTRFQDRGIPLRQGFGLTEVGPNCFSTPPSMVMAKVGSVGLPIHHIEAKVVRDDGTECDVDEPGELLLRGPIVCGGYWADAEATAKSIVDGWFHTGDVLSRDADGFFYVRGRKKEMYISGGENVYPAEVEGVIETADGVSLVAVVGVPDARWGEVGHAFVQPAPGAELTEAALKAFLDGRLAKFKRPKRFTVLPELPLTGSGKIDKPLLRRIAMEET
jgi:fatty-acyl-CoA synthase